MRDVDGGVALRAGFLLSRRDDEDDPRRLGRLDAESPDDDLEDFVSA